MLLTPTLQLCLAHFCEVHGPTPLMVTEGLPVKCSSCDGHDASDLMGAGNSAASSATSSPSSSTPHTATAAATAAVADVLRRMNLGQISRRNSPESTTSEDLLEGEPSSADTPTLATASQNGVSRRSPRASNSSSRHSPPPPSPLQPSLAQSRTDTATSNFRKTYDESVTKRANPCDNCAMTLPQSKPDSNNGSRSSGSNGGSGGSGGSDSRNPTLRTRVPCARVYDGATGTGSPLHLHPSSSTTSSSTSSDAEGDERPSSRLYGRNHHRRTGTMTSIATSQSSASSSASRLMGSHNHYVEYTSTHEPVSANAYCIIRASCLRTLTLETLPRSPASTAVNTPGIGPLAGSTLSTTSYFASTQHSTASVSAAAAAAANGGPLFFGDPAAGYTTAHVFRVTDVHARGHKRVYALIALNTHRERMAMKAFGFISSAFNDLATWIQQLADTEAERAAMQADSTATSSPTGDSSPSTSTNPSLAYDLSPHISPPPTLPSAVADDNSSSFLVAAGNGLSRRMGPGFAGFGGLGSSTAASLRARGLPEILGKPDFFIDLHAHFVRLLLELGVVMNQ